MYHQSTLNSLVIQPQSQIAPIRLSSVLRFVLISFLTGILFVTMPLLTTQAIGRSFGPVDIFEDITLSIPKRARIAIVGPNGVGKTTLLKILAGVDEPSKGSVHRAKGLRIGYLPQEATLLREGTLWDAVMQALKSTIELGREVEELERLMQNPDCDPSLLDRYGRLQSEFDRQGGYTYQARVRQTLQGLGFDDSDFGRPLTQLSGGQRTRAVLARLLLEGPDLLLLDEPSNHLDINAVEWLEGYLRDWDGAVVIVSHDRYFIDQSAKQVWEMTPALEVYRGNYSAYLRQREARYARRLAEFESQNEYIAHQEDYIKKNIGTQNNAQAKGRLRRLERLLEDSRLTAPRGNQRPVHLRFAMAGRSGNLVLRTYDLEVGYADEGRPLFKAPDLILERTECVAIVGPNGAGKTTFLKTLLGQIPPYHGRAELGASLKIGYFAQAHELLSPENTLIEEINRVIPTMLPAEARNYLAKFGFQGDEVFALVETLSGGERGRLALAKLALSDANMLLLDEPTNHLDLATQEVLQKVMADYPGTILLVSHDRYLIDALATQIWEMDPVHSELHVFKGTWSEYKEYKSSGSLPTEPDTQISFVESTPEIEVYPQSPKRQLSRNQRQQLNKKINAIEETIRLMEAEISLQEAKLANPPADARLVAELASDYGKMQSELEEKMAEWEDLAWTIQEAGDEPG